jgi:hypothetical protein
MSPMPAKIQDRLSKPQGRIVNPISFQPMHKRTSLSGASLFGTRVGQEKLQKAERKSRASI